MTYNRCLLKISGEALTGKKSFGIDLNCIYEYSLIIKKILKKGIQLAIVVGGGNIFRGSDIKLFNNKVDRIEGDYIGMLSTVINGLAFKAILKFLHVDVILQSPIKIGSIVETYIVANAINYLEQGKLVIFVSGTGNPYFTTDTAAMLRGIEIKSDIVLKGTNVDFIYNKDPNKFSNAKKLTKLSFKKALSMNLKIMDNMAFVLGLENELSVIVFNIKKKNNIYKAILGESIGSLISN